MAGNDPLKVWFDGSSRPNPGPMRTAVVARGQTYLRDVPGSGDNNDAEWHAALHALEVARDLGAGDVILLGDSALVVNQAQGIAPCRAARFGAHLAGFQSLAASFQRLRIKRIRRTQNLAGIALEQRRGQTWQG